MSIFDDDDDSTPSSTTSIFTTLERLLEDRLLDDRLLEDDDGFRMVRDLDRDLTVDFLYFFVLPFDIIVTGYNLYNINYKHIFLREPFKGTNGSLMIPPF